MNSLILNRDFQHPADGWYQIESKGNHPNRAAGVVQVIDDEATQSIVNRFNEDAAANKLRHGSEMLIDHEHFSDQPDQETRAYGWLTQLQNRDDGIYGRIRWTATGKPAVDGGDYRFFSTEYEPSDLKLVNDGKPKRVRPLRLAGLTLTNMNNNRGQRPITNRDMTQCPDCGGDLTKGDDGKMKCADCGKDFADASASAASETKTKNRTNTMKSIANKLGLAAEASEESILAEVTRLMNRVTELIPHEEENKTLKNRIAAFDSEQITTLLDLYGVKEEKLRNRIAKSLESLKNREERVTALTDFGYKLADPKADKGNQARVINRSESGARQENAGADEQELAQKAEREIVDYKIKNRCTYAEARNAIRIAKPELFGLSK